MSTIPGLTTVLPSSPAVPAARPGEPRDGSFLSLLGDQLQNVNEQHAQANHHIRELALGKSDGVQDVVLSVAKADLMFRMVLEIRNRLIDSYQEVMRMQI
jgi:flagellar hook-basal body complex protein FliE